MKIYQIITAALLMVIIGNAEAQRKKKGDPDDMGRIVLSTYVPSSLGEDIPRSVNRLMESKLKQIATKNGMGGTSYNPRFVITADMVLLNKDVTPTAPPQMVVELEATIYVGDAIDGTLFSSETFSLKGVGANENKAFSGAMRGIRVSGPNIAAFVEGGKKEIIKYYEGQCDGIIQKAQAMADQKEFDAAIFQLMQVPEVCSDCYARTLEEIKPIYQQKIDRDCKGILQTAESVWAAEQSFETGMDAARILSQIDPDAECFEDVKDLVKKIEKRVAEIDEREWDFELDEQKLDGERITAMKEVGVAYGENQQADNVIVPTGNASWIKE